MARAQTIRPTSVIYNRLAYFKIDSPGHFPDSQVTSWAEVLTLRRGGGWLVWPSLPWMVSPAIRYNQDASQYFPIQVYFSKIGFALVAHPLAELQEYFVVGAGTPRSYASLVFFNGWTVIPDG